MTVNDLAEIVDEFISIQTREAEELERFIAHVEQVAGRMPDGSEMAIARSSLAGLHQRLRSLRSKVAASS